MHDVATLLGYFIFYCEDFIYEKLLLFMFEIENVIEAIFVFLFLPLLFAHKSLT